MRTTTDLPPAVHRRASELARARRVSLSAVVAELTARGLASLDQPVEVITDPVSGLPSITIGRRITTAEVDEVLDEE